MRALARGIWSRATDFLAPRETTVKRIYVASADPEEHPEEEEVSVPDATPKVQQSPKKTGPSAAWVNARTEEDVKVQVEADPLQQTDTTVLPAASTGERRVSFEATKIQAAMRSEPREPVSVARARPEWKDPPSINLGPKETNTFNASFNPPGDLDGLDALRDPTEVFTEQLKRWNKHMTAQESQEPRPWNGNVRMTWTIHMARN